MDTKRRGEIVEQRIILWFMENGYSVLEPIGDSDRYDMVVDVDGNLYRIQAKKGWLKDGTVRFNARSTTSNRNNNLEKEYSKDEIDTFIVYCEDVDEFYWVPIEDVSGNRFHLRTEEPKSNHSSINWAKDYLLSEKLK